MATFRVSARAERSELHKIIRNTTLREASKRVEGMVRFLSLMPLDIPNREVDWKIEMLGRKDEWHVILAGKARVP